jgi:hypothetical protein
MTPSHAEAPARAQPKRLTGAHAGRVLSREIEIVPGAEAVGAAEGHTRLAAEGEERRDLARSYVETPSMRGSVMHENRETPWLPRAMALWAAVGSPRTSSTDARPRGV